MGCLRQHGDSLKEPGKGYNRRSQSMEWMRFFRSSDFCLLEVYKALTWWNSLWWSLKRRWVSVFIISLCFMADFLASYIQGQVAQSPWLLAAWLATWFSLSFCCGWYNSRERTDFYPDQWRSHGPVSVFLVLQTIPFSQQGHISWGKSFLQCLEAWSVAPGHITQWLVSSPRNPKLGWENTNLEMTCFFPVWHQ